MSDERPTLSRVRAQAPPASAFVWRVARLVGERYFDWYHRFEHSGSEHVPLAGPVLIVANHASNLDPLALAYGVRRRVYYLGKRELFQVPVLGYGMRLLGCFPIDRDDADVGAARTSLAVLRAGLALGMFPEGTRTRNGHLQPFKPGLAKIAVRARTPVLPAGITGTFRALPPGAHFPRPARIRVRYGVPFELCEYYDRRMTDADAAEATERIHRAVAALLE